VNNSRKCKKEHRCAEKIKIFKKGVAKKENM
jgi:hypothetical protein